MKVSMPAFVLYAVLLVNAMCFPNDVDPAAYKFSTLIPSNYDDDMNTVDTSGSDLKRKFSEDNVFDLDSSRSSKVGNLEDAIREFCENPKNNATCSKDSADEGNGSFQPIKMRIKRDTSHYEESDNFNAQSCMPTKLKTAEALCKAWPSRVVCNLYCIHGHTFEEGIMRQTLCKPLEGMWTKDFDECRPFVDCVLQLKLPGNLKCITNEVQHPPVCQVDCEAYEMNEQMTKNIIKCDAYGRWKPNLPFCVEPKGIKVVMAPSQREHTKVDYPK